jgi:opacity protein-like surface antigen
MKKLALLAAACVSLVPAAAFAQDSAPPPPAAAPDDSGPKSPDGSKAFGIEPYVGVLGGYESFDRRSDLGTHGSYGRANGGLISGVIGVNVPLGPAFVGVEGNGTKGFGDLDWEYGVKGRVGARVGDSGLLFVSGGYEWVDTHNYRGYPNSKNWVYGLGVELGPKDIGLKGATGRAGPRLRLQVDTYDFHSIRPMGGVIFHF